MRILIIYKIADCQIAPVMSGAGVQEVLPDSAEDNKEEKKEELADISETNNLGSSWTLLEKEEQDDELQVIFH